MALLGCGEAAPQLSPMEQVAQALDNGEGFDAELVLRRQLDEGVPREDLAAFLGQSEMLQGNYPEARYWLEPGEFSDDTRGLGFLTLGRLEMRVGNLPAAGQAFDRAYAVMPDDPGLWADIGRLRYRGGQQTMAVEASERAVELGPEHPRALQFRAQLVRDAEGMRAALPWFERAVAVNPDDNELLIDYAATLGEMGRAAEMLDVVRKTAEDSRDNRQIFYLQAVLAARAGKFVVARGLLERSGWAELGVPAGLLLSGIIDLQNDNAGSATQTFGQLAVMQPENRRVALLLARALDRSGSYVELIDRFEEQANLPSASPYLVTLVGRAHEALGQREIAAQFLDRASQMRSGNLVALRGDIAVNVLRNRDELNPNETLALVRALIVDGKRKQAVSEARGFLRDHAGSADAMVLAGDALLADYRLKDALAQYRSSAAIRRPWPLARKMVYVLQADGQDDAARELLAAHLAGDPFNAEATNLLARSEFAAGRMDQAAALADHALAIGSDRDPFLLALRAQMALRLGQPEADIFAQRARAIQPLNVAANETLALVLNERRRADAVAVGVSGNGAGGGAEAE